MCVADFDIVIHQESWENILDFISPAPAFDQDSFLEDFLFPGYPLSLVLPFLTLVQVISDSSVQITQLNIAGE
jgi:hypothetical protein